MRMLIKITLCYKLLDSSLYGLGIDFVKISFISTIWLLVKWTSYSHLIKDLVLDEYV